MSEISEAMTALVCISPAVFYLFWIVFTGTFALHELLVGIFASAVAATGFFVVNVQYPAKFSPRASDLMAIWRIPWYILSGSWEIAVVAAKDLAGTKRADSLFRIAHFSAGGNDDSYATARRVLAVAYTTIAPNFIVVGINTSNQKLLFHQIERSAVPKMTRTLGALQ